VKAELDLHLQLFVVVSLEVLHLDQLAGEVEPLPSFLEPPPLVPQGRIPVPAVALIPHLGHRGNLAGDEVFSEVLGDVAHQGGFQVEVVPVGATVVCVGEDEDLHVQDILNGQSSSHSQEGLILEKFDHLQVELDIARDVTFWVEQKEGKSGIN